MPSSLAMSLLALLGVFAPILAQSATHAGCGTEDLTAGSQSIAVISSGLSRSVLLYVPAAAAARRALPLIIDLHGSGSNGEEQARTTRLSDLAAKDGFVVANPSGGVTFPDAPNKHYWNIPGVPLSSGAQTPADAPDDVQFMASLLACRWSTRIAAIAPVSGLRAGLPSGGNPSQPDRATCHPQRAVPIVTFHGTGDLVNPYNGDSSPRWRYSPCEQGGGHAWPGSVVPQSMVRDRTAEQLRTNKPGTEIDASELMWQFFKAHRLP
jgi:polyhydroxybutyrate depolymerase